MKRYRILVASPAAKDLEEAYLHIREDSADMAARWRMGLLQTVESLETLPGRCPLAPENGPFAFEILQLLYGDYRLLFTIQEDAVVILHVRHGAREWLTADEVIPPDPDQAE